MRFKQFLESVENIWSELEQLASTGRLRPADLGVLADYLQDENHALADSINFMAQNGIIPCTIKRYEKIYYVYSSSYIYSDYEIEVLTSTTYRKLDGNQCCRIRDDIIERLGGQNNTVEYDNFQTAIMSLAELLSRDQDLFPRYSFPKPKNYASQLFYWINEMFYNLDNINNAGNGLNHFQNLLSGLEASDIRDNKERLQRLDKKIKEILPEIQNSDIKIDLQRILSEFIRLKITQRHA